MIITPCLTTFRRPQKPLAKKCRSFRDISRRYFRFEHKRSVALESFIFIVLAAVAIWPILNAAAVIQNYLP